MIIIPAFKKQQLSGNTAEDGLEAGKKQGRDTATV